MATLVPFRALRPPPAVAAKVASPPYDVVSTREARALAKGNADSFLRVSRPEIDLPEGTDEHSEPVYAKGAENLRELVSRGVLRQDPEPRLYVYAQRMGEHRQTGLVACASVDEYDRDVIKKHEKTRADKEDDRVRHIDTLSAHDEPVFLTYRAVAEIDRAVLEVKRGAPEYDLVTPDGVGHQLWVVPAAIGARIEALFREVPALYVADGHHRSAAASRVHARRRGREGEHGVFLAVVFPHDQMQILAYNRLVRDPQGRSPDALLAALRAVLDLEPASDPRPDAPLSFGVFLGGRWWRARVRAGSFDAGDPVAALDCSIAQDQLLAPLFGIRDPRTSTDVDFVGGIRGAAELERRVKEEGWSLALHLFPTRIEQLIAVSDAGKLMPPKSTWFEPKLRSGLFVHAF
jgi:uncharacterized protein (DUF1015 family)